MKAIKIIFFVLQGLFVHTQMGVTQQSFFKISDLRNKEIIQIRFPVDSNYVDKSHDFVILQELVDIGYFDVKFDSTYRDRNDFVYQVNLGNRYRLKEIIIQDNSETKRFVRNEYFDVDKISTFIQDQLQSDEQEGYPYSSISVTEFQKNDKNNILVYLKHDRGPKIHINSLYFSGNRQLSDHYLSKLTRFRSNSVFKPSTFSDIEIVLRNSFFIQDVSHLSIIKQNDTYLYGFEVLETQPSSLDLIIGYEPDALKGNKFVGNGSLRLLNLFSEGSLAWIQFQKLAGSDSRLNIEYDQFWYNDIPFQIGAKFWLTQRDSSYQKITTTFSSSIQFGNRYSFGVYAGYNSTRGVNSTLTDSAINNGELLGGINVGISDLDRRISPTNGFTLNLVLSTGIKKMQSSSPIEYPRSQFVKHSITLHTQIFKRIANDFVFTSSVNLSYLDMDQYFEDDLFFLGGTKSLRGYREEQFRSSSFVWSDTEFRYLIDNFSFIFIYGAIGYHQFPIDYVYKDQFQDTQLLYSSGFGLNYKIRIGLLKLTYAIGSQDQIVNGKVHFGITNFF